MPRWPRTELEDAFEHYQAAALRGAQQGDWRAWADCFTVDATYYEHHFGRFWGRETIYRWITDTMKPWPACDMTAFPVSWHSIDKQRGWIFCEVMNRMNDLGDGVIYEEPNLTVLHYAGHGLFSYEEDAYNPANMQAMLTRWIAARKRLQTEPGQPSEQ